MVFKMILAISGLHGTGKSTIARKIAEKLGLAYYSTGNAFRDLADNMNLSLEDFSKYVEDHPNIDKDLDNKVVQVAKKGNIVVESQLSGYLLENIANYKILLKCPLEIRVKRMAERDGTNYEKKLKETKLREKSELERFKILYNIDLGDEERAKQVFDYILDTQYLSIDEVVNQILTFTRNSI